jgi:glycosyltransferase involved in cell wall biosynthesis
MHYPLVSIIIPCYNNKNVILEAINSALDQSYPNIEIIVVDDGSTDNSYDVIHNCIGNNGKVQFVRQENRGPAAARNTGFSFSSGEYLVFLDGDDMLHKDYVETCLQVYDSNPALNIVYCDAELFENKTGLWKLHPFSESTILLYNSIPVFAMIRSGVFNQIGKYDTRLKCSEDWELWIRLLQEFSGVYKIPKVLYYYRKRNEKTSITDCDKIYNFRDDSLLYIYTKHQQLYRDSQFDMTNLLSFAVYKEKYYNEWYRKLFYRLFKRKKYAEIYTKQQPHIYAQYPDWPQYHAELKSAFEFNLNVESAG